MSRVLPILFNTDMVRAILDGRNTVTRRVVKPANPFRNKEGYCQGNGLWIDGYSKDDEPNGHIKDYSVSSCWWPKRSYIEKYAPYQPGDILYVRETWSPVFVVPRRYLYKVGCKEAENLPIKWHPSIHMPKEAARIWLKVKDVRVERLQDITEEQVDAGGFQFKPPCLSMVSADGHYCDLDGPCTSSIKYCDMSMGELFGKELWNSTIKKPDIDRYGWDASPWVWVIEFERCEKPEGWCV